MTKSGNIILHPDATVGPITGAIAATGDAGEVKRSKRMIPPQFIGGGFVVIRRTSASGALRSIARSPYEHPTLEAAEEEARCLAERHGESFDVFERRLGIQAPEKSSASPSEPFTLPLASKALDRVQIKEPAVLASQRPPLVVERRVRRAMIIGGRG